MTKAEWLAFMRQYRWAVQSSVSIDGRPQSALVGFATSDAFELIFDSLRSTRKIANLRSNPEIAVVIGGWLSGDERTVQFEGVADILRGAELERLKTVYFGVFPERRTGEHQSERAQPELVYVRAAPVWIRFSNFNCKPPAIHEFRFRPSD